MAATPAGAAAVASLAIRNSAMTRSQLGWAVGGWAFFIVENAVLSENRDAIIYQISSQGYYALYGTASTAATVGILYGYRTLSNLSSTSGSTISTASSMIPRTTIPNLPRIGLAIVIQSIGLILAGQAIPSLQIPFYITNNQLQVRCPFDFARDRRGVGNHEKNGEHHGATDTGAAMTNIAPMARVSRHASLWALGLTTLGASLLQPTLPMALWMTGPTAVAWIGGTHADSRFRRGIGGHLDPEYERVTSHVPFYALCQQGTLYHWWTEEVKPLNAVLAVSMASAWAISRRRLPVASIAHIFLRKLSS